MSGRASFNPGRRTDVREVNQPNAFMEVISETFRGFCINLKFFSIWLAVSVQLEKI